jgi:hypothetical protein
MAVRILSSMEPYVRRTAIVKRWLEQILTPSQYREVVRVKTMVFSSAIVRFVAGWYLRDDLNRLARFYGTDKWGAHWYTQHYQRYFAPLRKKALKVLEIGIGGYTNSGAGGASLRMWKAYFRKSQIVGIDLYDKTRFSESRIDIRQCDQADSDALVKLSNEFGGFDIIIDDGSHLNDDVIKTFKTLFPQLRQDGIYIVEDTQTAYWPSWGGGLDSPRTSMAFFKNLLDGLNHVEYPLTDYQPTYFDRHIVEVAFFHNLVVIRKGINDELPNMPELVQREFTAVKC